MLPDPVPFGPASRYAGLSHAEVMAWQARLCAAAEQWWLQTDRFRSVGVTVALGGPCGRALAEAGERLLAELVAVRGELDVRAAELRREQAA
jgi:hypothetical protein